MSLSILSALLRFMLTILITYKLVRWGYMLNQAEKFGLGVMGGSGFLTIPVIIDAGRGGTPFDVWAGLLFTLGVMTYLGGRLSRHIRHEHRNEQGKDQAREYFRGKA